MPKESENCPDVGKGNKVGKPVIELQEKEHLAKIGELQEDSLSFIAF